MGGVSSGRNCSRAPVWGYGDGSVWSFMRQWAEREDRWHRSTMTLPVTGQKGTMGADTILVGVGVSIVQTTPKTKSLMSAEAS